MVDCAAVAKNSAPRPAVPRVTKDAILKEFNHRCAVCSRDRPHIHHIDEDRENNDPLNLIPLCPSCHLSDQNDASNAIPIGKLRFFRRHKHRHILKPQFNAVFRRLEFLQHIEHAEATGIEGYATELADFIWHLPMGAFYSDEIRKLLEPPASASLFILGDRPDPHEREKERREEGARVEAYRRQVSAARHRVEHLIVELLDFQTWPEIVPTEKSR